MMANSLLERRRIEAEFTKGILEALAAEIGRERAVAVLTKAIETMAEKAGAAFAAEVCQHHPEQPADLDAFAQILPRWQAGDALAVNLHAQEANSLEFDVTHCAFADMYRELGMSDLGGVLSCNRDGGFSKGFNPEIEMTRTQTIMGGAAHCDFRFKLPRPQS
jgi:predicted ArsR family transcriptional regulator